MDEIKCSGEEASLDQCLFNGWGKSNCESTHDVAVSCDQKHEQGNKYLLSRCHKHEQGGIHHGLHCLLIQRERKQHFFLEIMTWNSSIYSYTMDHPYFIVCSFMENSFGLKRLI